MRIEFKMFSRLLAGWEQVFQETCTFATQIDKELLINITHSDNEETGVVIVWYGSK